MELFFDVGNVFAVTKLSQALVEHSSVRGALETLALFAAVWWAGSPDPFAWWPGSGG
jgi:low temperature requirement protein LtrA